MAGWERVVKRVARSRTFRAIRVPVLFGLLASLGYVGVVLVNQGRSMLGTVTVAAFVGVSVATAAFFWRPASWPLRRSAVGCRNCSCASCSSSA